jgi:hypothetical protein
MSIRNDGYVYCLWDKLNGICRIGKTAYDAKGRIEGQLSHYPYPLTVTKQYAEDALRVEMYLHDLFLNFRVKNSWYRITPTDFNNQIKIYKKDFNNNPFFKFDDEIDRGVCKWTITANEKELDVYFVPNRGNYTKICFKTDEDKYFYVKLPAGKKLNDLRKVGIKIQIDIYSINLKKCINGILDFKEIDGVDKMVMLYCKKKRMKRNCTMKNHSHQPIDK